MALIKIERSKIHLGINNRFYQLPFVHPWLTFFTSYLFIIFILSVNSNLGKLIYSVIISLPVCILIILFFLFYHRNSCYKIVVNNKTKEITFHLMFTHKYIVTASYKISVEIGREIMLITEDKSYRILSETLHDVVSYLPPDITITYKGFFGKHFKKELEKLNKPLTPGKNY